MIFTPEHCELISQGRKTQTRRRYKHGDMAQFGRNQEVRAVYWAEPIIDARGNFIGLERTAARPKATTRWVVGQSYAIQPGRGQKAVGRIKITAIAHCAIAGVLSESDARAEGYESVEGFRDVYVTINGKAALDKPCWALTFKLVE